MTWRTITADIKESPNGQFQVRRRQQQQPEERSQDEKPKWDIWRDNGGTWGLLSIPPSATKEEAIEKATIAMEALSG